MEAGVYCGVFFFKQKTAYEVRISDWSSDVCSSDLEVGVEELPPLDHALRRIVAIEDAVDRGHEGVGIAQAAAAGAARQRLSVAHARGGIGVGARPFGDRARSAACDPGLKIGLIGGRKRVVSGKSVSGSVDLGGRRIR